ncbi:MAG: hypothetical protein N2999_04680 [Proteobacteria bacterium]|nr:hypothetical protein [Pseudomonadota bacterium]
MKNLQIKTLFFIVTIILMSITATIVFSQEKHRSPSHIIVYKGETAGTGPGIGVLKMNIGEEITVTAAGFDSEGKEVPIWPTWKADKELSIRVVEGKSKSAVIKALKEGPSFFEAIYITEEGKKISGGGAVEIKAKR